MFSCFCEPEWVTFERALLHDHQYCFPRVLRKNIKKKFWNALNICLSGQATLWRQQIRFTLFAGAQELQLLLYRLIWCMQRSNLIPLFSTTFPFHEYFSRKLWIETLNGDIQLKQNLKWKSSIELRSLLCFSNTTLVCLVCCEKNNWQTKSFFKNSSPCIFVQINCRSKSDKRGDRPESRHRQCKKEKLYCDGQEWTYV